MYQFIKTFKNSNTCVVCGFSCSPGARVMRMKINALRNFNTTLNCSLRRSKFVVNYNQLWIYSLLPIGMSFLKCPIQPNLTTLSLSVHKKHMNMISIWSRPGLVYFVVWIACRKEVGRRVYEDSPWIWWTDYDMWAETPPSLNLEHRLKSESQI